MKRIFTIILAALLLAVSFNVSATKAYPYPIKVTQPDGSVIEIQMHGDENSHWITSEGKVVEKAADGFFRPVSVSPSYAPGNFSLTRKSAPQKVSKKITTGENNFLVILVEFTDLSFTVSSPQQAFSNMLNQEGYSQNSATGSVKDYYTQMSSGAFKPTYDVYGPVKVSKNYSYYGSNDDLHAALAFWEACKALDSEIDFSDYDLDGDGTVDNIFFYYAGHNEAEGASSNTIWPHQWDMYSAKYNDSQIGSIYFDGKSLGTYACTSELKGYRGENMCGIGTFCHEFGHTLGLPDFYDTNYETNGSAYGMGSFSLMSDGNYNNNGCTPPSLTAIERQIIGWLKDIPEWTEPGVKTVPDIMDNQAFMTGTNTDGEYFVYETRGGSVWDQKISTSGASGLLIYHVDKSGNRVSGYTAASLWNSNTINAFGSHPCCQPEPSGGNFNYAPARVTYPGALNVTAFDENSSSPMLDWNGNGTGRAISNIKYSNGEVTLTFGLASGKEVSGTVKDIDGNPVPGASVVLTPVTSSKSASRKSISLNNHVMKSVKINKAASQTEYSATISDDGTFSFDLSEESATEFTLSVSCHGYIDYANTFKLTVGTVERNVVLQKISVLGEETEFQRFDWSVDYATSFGEPVVAAIKYPADELAGVVGSQMTTITYALNAETSINEARLIVDFGTQTALNLKFNPQTGVYADVDITSYDIVIPSGKDVYVGIYVDCAEDDYPFLYNSNSVGKDGFYVRSLNNHTWTNYSGAGSLALSFMLKATHSQPYAYGYNGIANPKDGKYMTGESFKLELVESSMAPESVEWFYDNKSVTGPTVTVTAGEHVVKAVLHFDSGRTETIEQIILGS